MVPFTILSKTIKFLRIKLANLKDFYNENFKSMRKLKKKLKK